MREKPLEAVALDTDFLSRVRGEGGRTKEAEAESVPEVESATCS
jgi:hypothetical protein